MEKLNQQELKLEFAASLLRHPDDPDKAAFAITDDTGLALQIARSWPKDPVVIGEQERLLLSGSARTFLPTKEVQARRVYDEATSQKNTPDDRLKAHRLYAELMSYIEKPVGTNVNILNQTQTVMLVKDHGTDEDWEKNLQKQQRTLIGNARVN